MIGIYHYSTLKKLKETVWRDAIYKNDIQKLIAIDKQPFYYISRGLKKYVLYQYTDKERTHDVMKDFPLVINDSDQFAYNNDMYERVTGYQPINLKSEKTMSMSDLLINLCPFDHSNPTDFFILKILNIAGLISRVNLTLSTSAGFGKDSVTDVLGMFVPDISNFTPNSMAAITYRVENRLMAINEITDLKKEDQQMLFH